MTSKKAPVKEKSKNEKQIIKGFKIAAEKEMLRDDLTIIVFRSKENVTAMQRYYMLYTLCCGGEEFKPDCFCMYYGKANEKEIPCVTKKLKTNSQFSKLCESKKIRSAELTGYFNGNPIMFSFTEPKRNNSKMVLELIINEKLKKISKLKKFVKESAANCGVNMEA